MAAELANKNGTFSPVRHYIIYVSRLLEYPVTSYDVSRVQGPRSVSARL